MHAFITRPPAPPDTTNPLVIFQHYSAHRRASIRSKSGSYFIAKLKSTDGYFLTVTLGFRNRAMDHVWHLLLLVAVYTTTLAVLTQNNLISSSFGIDTSSIWALSTTLALLLTFRAQRAAVRWWDSRAMWGKIIAINRMLASRLLSHHKQGLSDCTTTGPGATDDVAEFIINLVAFATATRNYLRKQRCDLNPDDFVGLLSSAEIANLDNSKHMVSTMVFTLRRSLDKLMPLRSPAPGWAGDFYTVTLHSKMSELIDELTLLAGGLERILNSPLPTVWVANLRTFLLLYFLLIPLLLLEEHQSAGYWVIPITIISAWVFLGIEASASDVDVGPFLPDRVNHVDVDGMVLRVEEDMEQVLEELFRGANNRR